MTSVILSKNSPKSTDSGCVTLNLVDFTLITDYLHNRENWMAHQLAVMTGGTSTPHTAEFLDSKRELASSTIQKFQEQIRIDVTGISGRGDDMVIMMLEAAHGCKATGSLSSQDFKTRLHRHINTLLHGANQTSSR